MEVNGIRLFRTGDVVLLAEGWLGSNLNQPGVVENPVDFGRPKNDVNGHGNGTLTLWDDVFPVLNLGFSIAMVVYQRVVFLVNWNTFSIPAILLITLVSTKVPHE